MGKAGQILPPAQRCHPEPAARRARDDTAALVVESAPLSPSCFKERLMQQRFARLGILFLMLAGTWLAAGSAAAQQSRSDSVLALVGGRLIDGFGGPPLENSVIVVRGNRVEAVGRQGEVAIPPNARVISTEGYTVLPGLMDMHVHLMLLGHGDYDHWDRTYRSKWRDVIMPIAARQLLLAGVTTVRDVGAPLEDILAVRDRINRGQIPGPRVFASGPFLQKTVPPLEADFRWAVSGPEDARAKTKRLIDAGVDLIKVIDQDQMTLEELKGIVETAHAGGKHTVLHAHRAEEIRQGIRAGADCFEHTGLATQPGYPDDVLAMLRRRSEEHTSELQSPCNLVCRLLLEKKKT